jgi:microcin C transport system substrate-binding protein
MENSPQLGAYYRHVVKAKKTGDREVTFTFDGPGNRELPQIVGQLPVLPKHWWEGADASGKKRDVTATTLEPPLGSGPYQLKEFQPGRSIVYEKADNYWGKDVNVIIGTRNFQQLRYEYFRDSTVALEAFKGDQVDWRTENSAKNWATAYDFPAVRDKKVVLEEFPVRNFGIMQAFAFNIRRDKFKDARVRRAFNFAFDFEEMNRTIFFSQYKRINSYFEGTELASSGLPEGQELEILQTVKDNVPADLFSKPYTNPVGGNPQAVRDNFRQALALFREAGFEIRDTKLVNAKTGEPLSVEFLVDDPATERFVLFYKPSLERIGIAVNARTVDSAQYENRLRQWDYDIIVASWGESLSPGNEQRGFWGSAAADQPGSRNYIGIKNPAIDTLIDRVIFTKDRAELVAATKALDRVLLWNFYVVPQWTYGKVRTGAGIASDVRRICRRFCLVVGCRQGGQGAAAVLISSPPPCGEAGWRSQPGNLNYPPPQPSLPAGALVTPVWPTHAQDAERHGMFSAICSISPIKYVNTSAPKGGGFRRSAAAPTIRISSPSIRSTPSS